MRTTAVALAIQLLLTVSAGLSAQVDALDGRVIDAHGDPVADAAVVLHRLENRGGRDLAGDTTDMDGRFAFEIPDGPADAIHFAAVRHREVLFVGTFFDQGNPPAGEYVIRVDSLSEAGAVVMPDGSVIPPSGPGAFAGGASGASGTGGTSPPGPEPPSRLATASILGLLVVGGGAVLLLARDRNRRRRRRELLIELAALEERPSASGSGVDQSVRSRYREHRATLRDRLRANL